MLILHGNLCFHLVIGLMLTKMSSKEGGMIEAAKSLVLHLVSSSIFVGFVIFFLFLDKNADNLYDHFIYFRQVHLGHHQQRFNDLSPYFGTLHLMAQHIQSQALNHLFHDVQIVFLQKICPTAFNAFLSEGQVSLLDSLDQFIHKMNLFSPSQLPIDMAQVILIFPFSKQHLLVKYNCQILILRILIQKNILQWQSLQIKVVFSLLLQNILAGNRGRGRLSFVWDWIYKFFSMQQQVNNQSQDFYIQEGDWIQLTHDSFVLYSEGFKSSQVIMKNNNESPLQSLFIIQLASPSSKTHKKVIHFNVPIILIHRLTNKYLAFNPNFANKSQLRLKSVLTQHCQFILKPFYRCQVIGSSSIRNKEEFTLSPAISQYLTQNINLVVGKYEKNNIQRLPIYSKKNEQSALRIIRKNRLDKNTEDISNLSIYQLKHYQTRKWLHCDKSKTEAQTFKISAINTKNHYGSFIMFQKGKNSFQEQKINAEEAVFIKFSINKKYISFDVIGNLYLSDHKTEESEFYLELYSTNSSELGIHSLIKIRHSMSSKYFSLQNNTFELKKFSAFNIFELNMLISDQLKTTIFINQSYEGLQEQFNRIKSKPDSRRLILFLKEIIKFIYQNKNIYNLFVKQEIIYPNITNEQQNIFYQIGIIDLLYQISILSFNNYQRFIQNQIQQKKLDKSSFVDKRGYEDKGSKKGFDQPDKKDQNSNEYNEDEYIYLLSCIVIAGICKNNKQNLQVFTPYVKEYIFHMGKINGPIELFYNIFCYNEQSLFIFEELEYIHKNKKLKAFELLCQHMYPLSLNTHQKIKMLKLLHGFLLNQNFQKLHINQEILLKKFLQNRFQNILLFLSNNESYDINILINKKMVELSYVIEYSHQYQVQLQIIYEQINLLISLCSRGSQKHIDLFRNHVSQQILKRYLNCRLNSKFKALFLKILIRVYLSENIDTVSSSLIIVTNPKKKGYDNKQFKRISNLSMLSNRLLEKPKEMEMQEVGANRLKFLTDVYSLNQIKELIKQIIKARIKQKDKGQQLISCLFAIKSFLVFNICEIQEVDQILKQLEELIRQSLTTSAMPSSVKLIEKYLNLLNIQLQYKLKIYVRRIFIKLRDQYNEKSSRKQYCEAIVILYNQFLTTEISLVLDNEIVLLLKNIIDNALDNNFPEIFLKASQIYHKFTNLPTWFLNLIKDSIIIESETSNVLLCKINKLSNALNNEIVQYMYSQESTDLVQVKKRITYLTVQLNQMLMDCNQDEQVNVLAQKIIAEFKIFDIILELIVHKQYYLEDEKSQLFKQIFKFIRLFFLKSDGNIEGYIHSIQKMRIIYRFVDQGQIQLLYQFTKMNKIILEMNYGLIQWWILALKSNKKPNVYIPLGLIRLIQEEQMQVSTHLQNVAILSKFIMNEPESWTLFIKMQKPQELSLKRPMHNQSIEQWILQITLTFRLFSAIIENSKELNDVLVQKIKSYISLKVLINLVEEAFVLQFESEEFNHFYYLIVKIIKRQIIKLFELLYMKHVQTCQIDYLVYFMQKMAMRINSKTTQSVSDDYLHKELIFNNYQAENNKLEQHEQLKEALIDYMNIQTGKKTSITTKILHQYHNNIYLFVNIYILFIFKLYDKISEIYPKDQQKYNEYKNVFIELHLLINTLFQKTKEIVQEKLVYTQYAMYYDTYNNALSIINQIIDDKIKLTFTYKEEFQDESITLIQGAQYLYDRQLEFVVTMYLRSRNKTQKYLYETILTLMYNSNVSSKIHQDKELYFSEEQLKKIYLSIIKYLKVPSKKLQGNSPQNFVIKAKVFLNYIKQCKINIDFPPTLEYPNTFALLFKDQQLKLNLRLKYYILLQTKLLENYFHYIENQSKRYDKIQFNTSKMFSYYFEEFKEKMSEIISYQILLHDKKMIMEQGLIYFQAKKNNFTKQSTFIHIELILVWLLLKIKYNINNIDRYQSIIIQVLILFKSYVKFIQLFGKKYVTRQLYDKIQLCLKIIFKCVTGSNVKMMMIMMQYQIWNQISMLLSLDDSFKKNQQEADLSTYDFIKQLTRTKLQNLPSTYIQSILQIYNNSINIYGHHNQIISVDQYSLIPIKSFFSHLKYIVILIIKEFKYLPVSLSIQFYSKIHIEYVNYNLVNIYEKYRHIFRQYNIFAVRDNLIEAKFKGNKKQLGKSVALVNGIELMAIKIHMEVLNSKLDNFNKYIKHRIDVSRSHKVRDFIALIRNYFIDTFMLFFGWLIKKKLHKKQTYAQEQVNQFFMTKIGKIQMVFHDKIYSCEFMIYPQCNPEQHEKTQCLRGINFISNQLKRQSILLSIQRFVLKFQNKLRFYQSFSNFGMMLFFDKYIKILKLISYIIVIINNVLLITDEIQSIHYVSISYHHPFQVLTIINFIDSIVILVVYVIKDMPLNMKIAQYNMSQGIGYYGRNFNEKSQAVKRLILAMKIMANPRFIYNLLYTIVVGLVLYNKLFAAILLLDVLVHIPSLKTLLLSIYRPRYQILLTLCTYIILQYFFSICMYFLFKDETSPYCEDLGECFGFIFSTTFKAVHGFVGFLFEQKVSIAYNFQLTFFKIFEDAYVVLIYQIMVALILGIVIESFTVARSEKLKQLQRLNSACIICNIDRSRFNIESKGGFQGHKSIHHNIFNYISFKYTILIKQVDLLSDFEISVISNKTSGWIPDGKAIQLQTENKLAKNISKS